VNDDEIQAALDDVFDQAVVFHAYTDYMRDYEMITYATADPRTGIPPSYDRYLFRHAVEVTVTTSISPEIWRRSLDERLLDHETGKDLEGYVRGVKWHLLYPGGKVVADSDRARRWKATIGLDFHEARIQTNAHDITLVFTALEVSKLEVGYAPFVVGVENHYVPPQPLNPELPDDQPAS